MASIKFEPGKIIGNLKTSDALSCHSYWKERLRRPNCVIIASVFVFLKSAKSIHLQLVVPRSHDSLVPHGRQEHYLQ